MFGPICPYLCWCTMPLKRTHLNSCLFSQDESFKNNNFDKNNNWMIAFLEISKICVCLKPSAMSSGLTCRNFDRFWLNIRTVCIEIYFHKSRPIVYHLVGIYVAPILLRLYSDFPALLVEKDISCPSLYYVRHEWEPE